MQKTRTIALGLIALFTVSLTLVGCKLSKESSSTSSGGGGSSQSVVTLKGADQ